MRPFARAALSLSLSLMLLMLCAGASDAAAIKGSVGDASKKAVANATVYAVPSSDIEAMAATAIEIKKGSTNDEPFEDSIAANKDKYKKAITDSKGNFTISDLADGKYFLYVVPSDAEHLPGGDQCSVAMSTADLKDKPVTILVSGKTPADATYVGTSKCLGCHKSYESEKKTLHKLGIRMAGKDSKLQDVSRFPAFDAGLQRLMAGATFYFHGFDKSRGFDKYLVSEQPPADPASVSMKAVFSKGADGKLMLKTENMKDPSDPARTYHVEMTYGGGLYKQRYLIRVGKNLFPFLQYNSEGKDSYSDRGRKPWRDYHADWLFNEEAGKLSDPPKAKSFDKECASCHYTGYSLTKTADGDYIAGAVNDPNGEADIDGDGVPNELNIGCEVCHGPGSAHVKASSGDKASSIVSPGKLAPERAAVICGQCHSRPQGNLNNDQPVDANNKMMLPGISRDEYLVKHTTREDADTKKDLWADGLHSKSHHQQYTDFIKSGKYRNGTQMLSCSDCHDPHGVTGIKHQMRAEVSDANNSLCVSCHKAFADTKAHTTAKLGVAHDAPCVSCHSTKTMQTGAGMGKGLVRGDGKNYWMNDITSHLFDVPRKDNVAVKGVEPGKAMPIPYTNSCGTCHNPEGL